RSSPIPADSSFSSCSDPRFCCEGTFLPSTPADRCGQFAHVGAGVKILDDPIVGRVANFLIHLWRAEQLLYAARCLRRRGEQDPGPAILYSLRYCADVGCAHRDTPRHGLADRVGETGAVAAA